MVEVTDPNDMLYSIFLKRAAAYEVHPLNSDALFFNPNTMESRINSPGFNEALKDLQEIIPSYPQNWSSMSISNAVENFTSGKVVFTDMWDDALIASLEPGSALIGKIGVAPSPGSSIIWDRNNKQWVELEEPNLVSYFVEGWIAGVSKHSTKQEQAFLFLEHLMENENHRSDLLVGNRGVNPSRNSDLEVAFWYENSHWSPSIIEEYLDLLKTIRSNQNRAFFLSVIRNNEYAKVLASGVFRAMEDNLETQIILDSVAEQWDTLTRSIGLARQREAYLSNLQWGSLSSE
jgi:multiple sugar transport system substrate-binding protein